jgi:bacillithiol biosynthesis cysteine-adding enzyme BshC
MNCTASFLPYGETGYFSKIVLDYIDSSEAILPFISHPVSAEGIQAAMDDRQKFPTDRGLLVKVLKQQYATLDTSGLVMQQVESLLDNQTFTVCTAHQPNIFTGHLYFVYKILHTIKLANTLNDQHPGKKFVPVFYMGSEDADLEELGHVYINGEKYEWKTNQTGAVGRMKIDKALVAILDEISGQLTIHPHGEAIIALMKACYTVGRTIEQATFQLVNELFRDFGLVILLPDNPLLKKAFQPVIERELTNAFSHQLVQDTVTQFPPAYKVQASGRELNMFYLLDDKRERIEKNDETWTVLNTDIRFTKDELLAEVNSHPERFSPNVILRPVLQEWLLPNIAFIGGGGEIAYWLQLKRVFENTGTPYPVLIVRNSFLFVSKAAQQLATKLKFDLRELFLPENTLLNQLVQRDSTVQVNLQNEIHKLEDFYGELKTLAGKVEVTLANHTAALEKQAVKKLVALEKKMLRAEKKKFGAESRQLTKLKAELFPAGNLQERVDNLMPYYSRWGKDFIQVIYDNSLALEQRFTILTEK